MLVSRLPVKCGSYNEYRTDLESGLSRRPRTHGHCRPVVFKLFLTTDPFSSGTVGELADPCTCYRKFITSTKYPNSCAHRILQTYQYHQLHTNYNGWQAMLVWSMCLLYIAQTVKKTCKQWQFLGIWFRLPPSFPSRDPPGNPPQTPFGPRRGANPSFKIVAVERLWLQSANLATSRAHWCRWFRHHRFLYGSCRPARCCPPGAHTIQNNILPGTRIWSDQWGHTTTETVWDTFSRLSDWTPWQKYTHVCTVWLLIMTVKYRF